MEPTTHDLAFAALADRYRDPLVRFFRRLHVDPSLSDDLAQEVLLRVYESRDRYVPRGAFAAYVFRVARNLWIDRRRASQRRPRELPLETKADPGGSIDLCSRLRATGPSPSEGMKKEETVACIRQAVAGLPQGERIVFELAEEEGMAYREIGRLLGIPVGTVKSRRHAAITRLRGRLAARREEL